MMRLRDAQAPRRGETNVPRKDMSPENRAIYDAAQRAWYAAQGLTPPPDRGRGSGRKISSQIKVRVRAWLEQHRGEQVSGREVSLACGLPTGNGCAGHWLRELAKEGLVRRVNRVAWFVEAAP